MQRLFTSISEPIADFKWQKFFRERWPAYKRWITNSGSLVDAKVAVQMLRTYMPEMVATHEHLCHLVRADAMATSFLTGFQPPVYTTACSQAVTLVDKVRLVRNYDYHPDRFEGVLLMSAWNGKKVIANSDCLMGVIDGMNEDGLAISLTFGGREVVGFGFGIPFILRYILEFCTNVAEAMDVLMSVPSHMPYNVTAADKSGAIKTIQIAPDRKPLISNDAFTTNHQGTLEHAESQDINQTSERAIYLQKLLTKGINGASLTNAFLKPPLYNTTFEEGFGTLYTAVYLPTDGVVQMHWLKSSMFQSFDYFTEEIKLISFESKRQLKKV